MTTTLPHTETPAEQADAIVYGAVELDVRDAERALAFWRDTVGLTELGVLADGVVLGAGDRPLIVLRPGAERPQLRGHAGLYHVALHLPDERELGRVMARLAARGVPQAPTDHIFSKATYLSDPDGIGLELTVETPERFVSFEIGPGSIAILDADGRRRGPTEPLDVREVLAHLGEDDDLDRPLPPGTTVGHVHLHVQDLDRARRFYRDVIGFSDHMFMDAIGMADLGTGGRFPHRLAVNVWQGPNATQPPAGTAGLRRFTLLVRDGAALDAVLDRIEAAGLAHERAGASVSLRDPAGNALTVGVAGSWSPTRTS